MKAIITIAFAAGLFSVVPTAGAQNAAISSLSGNVPQATGNDEFCLETAAEQTLECVYASMDECQDNNKTSHLLCVPNPH